MWSGGIRQSSQKLVELFRVLYREGHIAKYEAQDFRKPFVTARDNKRPSRSTALLDLRGRYIRAINRQSVHDCRPSTYKEVSVRTGVFMTPVKTCRRNRFHAKYHMPVCNNKWNAHTLQYQFMMRPTTSTDAPGFRQNCQKDFLSGMSSGIHVSQSTLSSPIP